MSKTKRKGFWFQWGGSENHSKLPPPTTRGANSVVTLTVEEMSLMREGSQIIRADRSLEIGTLKMIGDKHLGLGSG